MELDHTPESITCSACGEPVDETGYLPATVSGDVYLPLPEYAVCADCGFNEIGMSGCAPELGDVIEGESNAVLLYISVTDQDIEIVSIKE